MFSQVCVCSGGGGSQVSDFQRGVPGLRFFLGGGGVPGLRFLGGGPRSQIFGGGPRSQIFGRGGSQVSDFQGGYLVSVKGKIFDTRFGLIHVQTGKKFLSRDPPPVKEKFLTPDLA